MDSKHFSCIVIGSGPAGISAAIYLKRNGINPLVIGMRPYLDSHSIENYFGIPGPVKGEVIVDAGLEQLSRLGIEKLDSYVIGYEKKDLHHIVTKDAEYNSQAIILACGTGKLEDGGIANLNTFVGKGVSHCAICDSFSFKNQSVAVIGNGDYAAKEAIIVSQHANKVTILSHTDDFSISDKYMDGISAASNIELKCEKVKSIEGRFYADSLKLDHGMILKFDGIFVAIKEPGSSQLALKMGLETDSDGYIKVCPSTMVTNVRSIFAAGDCVGGIRQVVVAAAQGCYAAVSASTYLLS